MGARAGRTLDEQVRLVCALGAVGGLDDFGAQLTLQTDPTELRPRLIAVVREILGVPATRRKPAKTRQVAAAN